MGSWAPGLESACRIVCLSQAVWSRAAGMPRGQLWETMEQRVIRLQNRAPAGQAPPGTLGSPSGSPRNCTAGFPAAAAAGCVVISPGQGAGRLADPWQDPLAPLPRPCTGHVCGPATAEQRCRQPFPSDSPPHAASQWIGVVQHPTFPCYTQGADESCRRTLQAQRFCRPRAAVPGSPSSRRRPHAAGCISKQHIGMMRIGKCTREISTLDYRAGMPQPPAAAPLPPRRGTRLPPAGHGRMPPQTLH
jgi:hypothetical protein